MGPIRFRIFMQIAVSLGVAAWVIQSRQHIGAGALDKIALILFVLLLAWLLVPNFPVDGGEHEDLRESFALRCGKACNRALKRLKSVF